MLKILQTAAVASILSCLLACNKDKAPLPDHYWGDANALKNGQNWANEPRGWSLALYGINKTRGARVSKDSFSLFINKLNQDNNLRETIAIGGLPIKIGVYKVFRFDAVANQDRDTNTMASFALSEQDGDVHSDYYNLLETEPNQVSVDFLDTIKREIRGKFTLSFINKYPKKGSPPDTIRFTNGIYRTRIIPKF